jgi:hypothetical protein
VFSTRPWGPSPALKRKRKKEGREGGKGKEREGKEKEERTGEKTQEKMKSIRSKTCPQPRQHPKPHL